MKKIIFVLFCILAMVSAVYAEEITLDRLYEVNSLSVLAEKHLTMNTSAVLCPTADTCNDAVNMQFVLGDGYTLIQPDGDLGVVRTYSAAAGDDYAWELYGSLYEDGFDRPSFYIFPQKDHDIMFADPWLNRAYSKEVLRAAESYDERIMVYTDEWLEDDFPGAEITYTLDSDSLEIRQIDYDYADGSSIRFSVSYDEAPLPQYEKYRAIVREMPVVKLSLVLYPGTEEEDTREFDFPQNSYVSFSTAEGAMQFDSPELKEEVYGIILEQPENTLYITHRDPESDGADGANGSF